MITTGHTGQQASRPGQQIKEKIPYGLVGFGFKQQRKANDVTLIGVHVLMTHVLIGVHVLMTHVLDMRLCASLLVSIISFLALPASFECQFRPYQLLGVSRLASLLVPLSLTDVEACPS
jgi:hypothetical protein